MEDGGCGCGCGCGCGLRECALDGCPASSVQSSSGSLAVDGPLMDVETLRGHCQAILCRVQWASGGLWSGSAHWLNLEAQLQSSGCQDPTKKLPMFVSIPA
jgi:hypothetical protein